MLNTIHQLFSTIGCHFQCYDMGRIIIPIEQQAFIDFELSNTPCNYPFMQHTWLGLVFWETKATPNHTVWFLKLPLDEQAKLNLAARDDFLRGLVDSLAIYLDKTSATADEKHLFLEQAMENNPYGFQPKQEQLANFHAIVHQKLSLPASGYYKNTQKFFSASDEFNQWQQLGLQGIADMAARLDEEYQNRTNQAHIIQAIAHLPHAPLQILGVCLENHKVNRELVQALLNRISLEQQKTKYDQSRAPVYIASIRASANAEDPDLSVQLLSNILNSSAGTDIEILATISGRCWQRLLHPQLLTLFLETLAKNDLFQHQQGQKAFDVILSDLMFIPGMRNAILPIFRSPERSETLSLAIGEFLKQKKFVKKNN